MTVQYSFYVQKQNVTCQLVQKKKLWLQPHSPQSQSDMKTKVLLPACSDFPTWSFRNKANTLTTNYSTLQSNPMWSYWCYDACMVNPHWSQREILNLLYTSGFIVSHSQLFLFLSGFGKFFFFCFPITDCMSGELLGLPAKKITSPNPQKSQNNGNLPRQKQIITLQACHEKTTRTNYHVLWK